MPNLASVGRFIAHNPIGTAGIGAGLGAAANVGREALSGRPDKNYLGAAVQGAAAGGVLGGATGGIARAARDTMLLRPELKGGVAVAKGTAQRLGEGVANFGHRQLHGLTGYGSKDQAYLDRIGIMGGNTSLKHNRLGNLRAEDMARHNPANAEKIFSDAAGAARGVAEEGAVGDRMRSLGMTSVPGSAKAFATNPREASRAIWDQARTGGALGVGAAVGLPLVSSAHSLSKGDESAQGGHTMGEKVLRTGANLGSFALGGVPIIPNMIAGGVAESLAGRAGRALTPRKPLANADPTTRIG